MPQSSAIGQHAERSGSWMLPEAKGEDLLYVALAANGGVGIFSYAGEQVGRLRGPSPGFNGTEQGMCSDGSGDVFVTDPEVPGIVKYQHAERHPAKVLSVEYLPTACSADPLTGNLAVAVLTPNEIAIFKNGSNTATLYPLPKSVRPTDCSYDGSGNLFIIAYHISEDDAPRFVYLELPAGDRTFKRVHLSVNIKEPGNVRWDGKYIVITDLSHRLYATVGAKVVKATRFTGGGLGGFWIQGDKLIAARGYPQQVDLWQYPRGGQNTESFPVIYQPYNVAVSLAPRR